MTNWGNKLLWAVYISLLAVVLPHTAWAFRKFEPLGTLGTATAWTAAFAFEAAIAALTDRLARHVGTTPRYTAGYVRLRTFSYRYLNPYGAGLVAAVAISALANTAHVVEFGQPLVIVGESSLAAGVYAVAFGAILPVISLLFARVLSVSAETEGGRDEELEQAKKSEREARRMLGGVRRELEEANARFGAAGDLFARLFSDQKRERILFVQEQWPELQRSAIALITESSTAYVSEVLNVERRSGDN
jgi:hypothetical protein